MAVAFLRDGGLQSAVGERRDTRLNSLHNIEIARFDVLLTRPNRVAQKFSFDVRNFKQTTGTNSSIRQRLPNQSTLGLAEATFRLKFSTSKFVCPVGTGAADDTRIRGRDYLCNAAVNAHRSLAGLASSLAILDP